LKKEIRMARWSDLVEQGGPFASIAKERLIGQVAYLATVRPDGGPRVHPVTPLVYDGTLFVRMYPTSPKGRDLRRDPRFAMHSRVDDNEGAGGELLLKGRASVVADETWIQDALAELSDPDPDNYIVFEFEIDDCLVTVYQGEETLRKHWTAN
jgi:hypothetical protein